MHHDPRGAEKATLFLISGREDDRLFLAAVSRAMDWQLRVYPDALQAVVDLDSVDEAYLFVDASRDELLEEFEKGFGHILGDAPGCVPAERVHFIGSEGAHEASTLKKYTNRFSHFIPMKFGNIEESGRHYARILRSMHSPITSEIDAIKSMSLRHSADKAHVLREIENIIRSHPSIAESCIQFILNTVDELLMNAVYDAPVLQNGEQLLKNVPRDVPIEIGDDRPVLAQLSRLGDYAAITVVDSFGSLNREKLLHHLLKGPQGQALVVIDSGAGAGIGLATTFHGGGSLLFRCDPGKCTEVTAIFRLTRSYRQFKDQFRFFSVQRIRDR